MTIPRLEFPPIAIIGLAGRFPGVPSVADFWQALAAERRLIQDFSVEELRAAGVKASDLANPHYVRSYGWLSGALHFDAEHFKLSPAEAAIIDPQHRLFLECAAEVIGGIRLYSKHTGARTGVFAGCLPSEYLRRIEHHPVVASLAALNLELGNDQDFLASRVAWHLGLNGPAVNVNAACATSLFVVHIACVALQRGECDLALAGAASIRHFFPAGYLAQPGGVLSPDGHCRPFDISGAGTVFGDAAACMALCRADDARRTGQPIYGLIVASATGNDGANRPSFAAPSAEGQRKVLEQAYASLGTAAQVTYVEAHGTGTLLGDELELTAMRSVFSVSTRSHPLFVGSVKANCGHLNAVAGLAGVIKVIGSFSMGIMPATIGVSSPRTDLLEGQLRLCNSPQPAPRLAGVSSFGMGGHSAHLVLAHPGKGVPKTVCSSLSWRRKVCALPGVFSNEERAGWDRSLMLYQPEWEKVVLSTAEAMPPCILLHEQGRAQEIRRRLGNTSVDINTLPCAEPPLTAAFDPEAWRQLFTQAFALESRLEGRVLVDFAGIGDSISVSSASEARWRLARQVGLLQAASNFPYAGLLTLVPDSAQGHPDRAALIALNLSARQERPLCPVSTLEVACPPEQAMTEIIAHAEQIIRSEGYLRIEAGGWFVRNFVRSQSVENAPLLVAPESVCIVIGGTGRIGSALAEMLSSSFGCKVVATCTPDGVERATRRTTSLRGLHVWPLCVEDATEVERSFAKVTSRFGRLDFVIHCASCPGDQCYQSLDAITAEHLDRVLTPKVAGTASLLPSLGNRPRTKLLAVSSLAAELGGLSLGVYSAACRYQDALLDFHRDYFGAPWVSVNLDHWELAADSAEVQRPEAKRVSRINPTQGLAFFRHLFSNQPAGRLLLACTPLPERAQKWLRRKATPNPPRVCQVPRGMLDRPGIVDVIRQLVTQYCPEAEFRADQSLAELGLDSLAAIDLAMAIHAKTGWNVSAAELFAAPDLDTLVACVMPADSRSASLVTILRSGSGSGKLLLIHPHGGGLGIYQTLTRTLDFEGQILGVRAQGLFGEAEPLESIETMAERYLDDLVPYKLENLALLGFSAGGLIALEMARQLKAADRPPRAVVLLDTLPPSGLCEAMREETLDEVTFLAEAFLGIVQLPEQDLRRLPSIEAQQAVIELWRQQGLVSARFNEVNLAAWRAVFAAGLKAYTTWEPPAIRVKPTLLLRGTRQTGGYISPEPDLGWSDFLGSDLQVYALPGEHHELLQIPVVSETTSVIASFLRAAVTRS